MIEELFMAAFYIVGLITGFGLGVIYQKRQNNEELVE